MRSVIKQVKKEYYDEFTVLIQKICDEVVKKGEEELDKHYDKAIVKVELEISSDLSYKADYSVASL